MSTTVWSGLIPVVAAAALWVPAAQAANSTCNDYYQDCLYAANQDPDSRVREIYTEQCYQNHLACENSPECGDYVCQGLESAQNSCPEDCSASLSPNNPNTVEGICSSSTPSTSPFQG